MTLPDFEGAYMPSMIPAAPKTYIIEKSEKGTVLRTPILAWAPNTENPYRAPYPITVDGLSRMITGRAIEFPCGMVHDRNFSICFTSAEEWAAMSTSDYSKPEATSPKAAPTPTPVQDSEQAASELQIVWTTSPFKTNSFYRYNDGTLDFIFQVEGGVNPPKQVGPVKKIKRDEFMAMKKTVDVAEVADLMEGRAPGLDDIGSFEEDGNDLLGDVDIEEDEEDLI